MATVSGRKFLLEGKDFVIRQEKIAANAKRIIDSAAGTQAQVSRFPLTTYGGLHLNYKDGMNGLSDYQTYDPANGVLADGGRYDINCNGIANNGK